ncbi:polysaccharide biosynthesis protein [Flavobacterium sp. LPB0248]|uniref:polysaccharide biosynthesis protein n=1 Tax=Flavobacterium sp. LPB0248 TaxID=2614441 RepID=UPI0015A7051A|nr:polysaccharide biosynthesis protein [Flavobacterium sp. LPB0248]QLC67475.1 polysaccharide biosynthesis protein [Flavobacterium sp. LPB0248]
MFIVIPYLTSDPEIYGIYTICISFSIFLSYADLGFVGAGQKFAAESYAQGNREEEVKIIGFTNFVLLCFLLFFGITFFILSFHPNLIVKGIDSIEKGNIASSLVLTLAAFTPTTILQRLLQMIFGIRMEDFIVQRINIIGSIIKISSILWFFKIGKYDIVGYFLFTQIINFLSAICALFIAKKRYDYDFRFLIKCIRFNREVFNKTKGLAYTSLFAIISWILYYELDTIVIGKFLGAQQVAIFAIGLTLLSFFRNIFGILFSPFNVRFNHFIGMGDESSLRLFYLQIVAILAPVIVFPIITIAMMARPFVLTWVGVDYSDSISVVQVLVFCNIFAFITYPTNFMLVAKEHQKALYLVNTLLPFIYWGGIVFTFNFFGVNSFAVFKLVAFVVSACILYKMMVDYLSLTLIESFKIIFLPMVIPLFFLILTTMVAKDFLPVVKSKINFIEVVMVSGILLVLTFIIQYFVSITWREILRKIIKAVKVS